MCVCWQQRRQRFFSLSPLLVHPGCLTLLWMLFFSLHLCRLPVIITICPFVSLVPDVVQSSSHPLNLSHHPLSPLCPGTYSPWRWWTGSAPRGTTGTTTAHRGAMRVTDPLRTWTRTSVSRWEMQKEKPMIHNCEDPFHKVQWSAWNSLSLFVTITPGM